MRLQIKLYCLTAALHIFLLGGAVLTLRENTVIFLITELLLVLSLISFLVLIKKILSPFEILHTFNKLLTDKEYNSRFRLVGSHDLDEAIRFFNQALNRLQEEKHDVDDRRLLLHQLLNKIPVGIVIFDFDDNISQINNKALEILNIEKDRIEKKTLSDISGVLMVKIRSLQVGQPEIVSDGTGKRFRCLLGQFDDRSFQRKFIVIEEISNTLDISEKNTYEKLIRLMSHEVNNTMAATNSTLSSCLDFAPQIEVGLRDAYEKSLRAVIERTDNLKVFMHEYAQIVRLPTPIIERCDLFALLGSLKAILESELHAKNILLELQPCNFEKLEVSVDRTQIERVFLNILRNAIESIGKNGEIRISFSAKPEKLVVKVADSGSGISSDIETQLFTPFFTTKPNGQGMGLMLIREILNAHKIEFRLKNAENKKGAEFELRFNI